MFNVELIPANLNNIHDDICFELIEIVKQDRKKLNVK